MNIEKFRQYCLSLKGAEESLPFDNRTLVFSVCNKMFSLTDIETFESINLKCVPEEAISLRERYPAVIPGYHMNKKHWNTILINDSIEDSLIEKLITDSYNLVVKGLTKKQKQELENYL